MMIFKITIGFLRGLFMKSFYFSALAKGTLFQVFYITRSESDLDMMNQKIFNYILDFQYIHHTPLPPFLLLPAEQTNFYGKIDLKRKLCDTDSRRMLLRTIDLWEMIFDIWLLESHLTTKISEHPVVSELLRFASE